MGGDIGAWGGLVNSNVTSFLDGILGNLLVVAMSNVDVTLTLSQWQNNGVFRISGTLTSNVNLILPLSPNSVGSATAVGGRFIVDNETVGNFTLTVKTAATSSTGVVIPQGARTSLMSDALSVFYADDGRYARVKVFAGNPNGVVTGFVGNPASVTPADLLWDTADQTLYVANGGTAWVSVGQTLPTPGGYITPVSGQPIITGDSVGASGLFVTPFRGNLCPIFNGSSFVVFSFAELPLALAAGSQLANGIYDVFSFVSAGAMQVGFGPSWLAGAVPGNVTPGACARGTGAASTSLARLNGVLVNAVAITLNNGASSFGPIAANQATYLGSVAIDATNGQVSNYLSYGGGGGGIIRKRGTWNYFNRVPIRMIGGSTTASWTYAVATFRQSNADANNAIMAFCGIAEEEIELSFDQSFGVLAGGGAGGAQLGIGQNSTTVNIGYAGVITAPTGGSAFTQAQAIVQPSLGLNQFNTLEKALAGFSTQFSGLQGNMLHVVRYNG